MRAGPPVRQQAQGRRQFENAPDSPVVAITVLRSLWQHNLAALKTVRTFGCERLRDSAVVVANNVVYSGNSPI
jgi:hypothetical protein